jgi:translocator protein
MKISFFLKKLPLSLLLCLGGGWLTGLITQQGVQQWYPHLTKPFGTPANIVFPIVWTILYFLMSIALALIWNIDTKQKSRALLFFAIQLFFNFSWSFFFFYFHNIGLALVDISLLWIFIFLTMREFWNYTHLGTFLLLPYLVWVTYALYLNLFFLILN